MDPWNMHVAMLAGTLTVPSIRWPAAATRQIRSADDEEPDLPPREPGGPSFADREVLAQLPATAAQLAAALRLPIETIHTRTCRMRARGLIRREGRRWHVVVDAPNGAPDQSTARDRSVADTSAPAVA